MQGFEEVTISWAGEDYTIPAERQLRLIALVEAAISGDTGKQAIELLLRPSGPPYAHLAMGFGAALRYAGASVTDDEIYLSIMEGFAEGTSDGAEKVQSAILALLSVIAPPIGRELRGGEKKEEAPATE